MLSTTTRLKVDGTGVHHHCCWYLIIAFVIISSMPVPIVVRAHAPPRSLYYGQPASMARHQIESREPFKHIPASLMFGHSAGAGPMTGNRLYDTPTCGQLRQMWKSSLKSLSDNNVMNNNQHNLDSNDIPLILNNPYYMAFLWRQSLQSGQHQPRPHFGRIVSEPSPPAIADSQSDAQVIHHNHNGKGISPKSGSDTQPAIPGNFMDKPSRVGVVYGHVIHSPEEAIDRPVADQRHRNGGDGADGKFGAFAPQQHISSDDRSSSSGSHINTNSNNNPKQSSVNTAAKQQRTTGGTKTSSTFSTADEFFKSGVWHEKPVVPSVSFQRIH